MAGVLWGAWFRKMDIIHRPSPTERKNTFVLIFSKTTGSPKVNYFQLDPNHNSRLIPKMFSMNMPRLKDLCGYRVIVHQGFLYVIGGKDWISGSFMSNVFRFDPMINSWMRRASLNRPRCRFTVDTVDENMIVTGGEIKGNKITASVEVYDPVNDIWAEVNPLPRPRADHASCVLGGKVYISGGLTNLKYHCSTVFWRYDPLVDRWTEPYKDANIPQEREKHHMVPIPSQNRLYLISGLGIDHKTNREVDESAVNSFNPSATSRTARWTLDLPPMLNPRNQAGCVRLGRRVYLFGGQNFQNNTPVRMIEYFDLKRKKWSNWFPLQETNLNSLEIVVLEVPNSNKEFCNLALAMNSHWIMW